MKIKHLLFTLVIALVSCNGNPTTEETTLPVTETGENTQTEEITEDTLRDEISEITNEINQIKEESEELGNEIDDLLKGL